VKGTATLSGAPLRNKAVLSGRQWIDVTRGSEVTVKHSDSGRELTLLGPARAMMCPHGEEQVVLSSGKLRTTMGAGARPGAEVMVATPAGTIRYGDALLEARVSALRVNVWVRAGDAWLEPIANATRTGTEHLVGPQGKASLAISKTVTAEELVTTCAKAAAVAAEMARAVVSNPAQAKTSLGQRAAEHLRARRAARAACASSAARVGQLDDLAERQRLQGLMESSERLWQVVPPVEESAPK